ncbi:SMI1/KNR4 family protein [Sphingomonas sp. GB1N7]|uniref:SMI1/KNR4 family protein n=1 Tax=Parasphingomonas caseinilytica TaxID=3096158 RepID=UPI002FC884FF
MQQPAFAKSLFRCDDATSLKIDGGNRFIRKLPDDRPLGYLHKFHAPLDNSGLGRVREGFGRPLPMQFEDFLQWSNGASLFDNQIYIFGFVEDFSRSLEPEKQQPISIIDKNRIFSSLHSDCWRDGWMLIGSAVGWSSNYDLELHEDGACALVLENSVRVVASFEQCITLIIDRISGCFSCDGILDGSYTEVEAALASLLRTQ